MTMSRQILKVLIDLLGQDSDEVFLHLVIFYGSVIDCWKDCLRNVSTRPLIHVFICMCLYNYQTFVPRLFISLCLSIFYLSVDSDLQHLSKSCSSSLTPLFATM